MSSLFVYSSSHVNGAVLVHHEPSPARAEVAGSQAGEGFLELLVAPERGHDLVVEVPAGLAASGGREGVPVEVVVVDLARGGG